MKTCKKLIAIGIMLLAGVLLLLASPMKSALAAEGEVSWRVEGDTLYIEGAGAMTDVAEGGQAPWYSHKEHVTKIVVGEGITSIGARSFSDFSRVQRAVLPATVMGIGDYGFRGCMALESIQLPKAMTAIGTGAFLSCVSLETVEIPENCGRIGAYAFAHCEGLKRAVLPTAVYYMGDYAFFGGSSLTSVQLPTTLTAVPNACFRDCTALVSVVLPSGMTHIGSYAFYGCRLMTECLLPPKLQAVGSYAFYGSGLQSVDLPAETVQVGEYAYAHCESLTTVTLPKRLKELSKGIFYGDKKLADIELPEDLESIGDEAFSYCMALESITLPENLRHIGAGAFAYAATLTAVDFRSVSCFVSGTAAAPAFQGCTSLSVFTFAEGVTVVPEALCYGLPGLTRVDLGGSVREIGKSAFEGCTALTKVTLAEGLQRVGEAAFYRCPALTALHVPASLRTVGYYGFFAGASCKIYAELTQAENGFDSAWNGTSTVLWQGQWVTCRFYVRGKLLDVQYLALGDSCTPPFVENDTPHVGYTAYFNGWDINGDGQADALPLQVMRDMEAVALYRELPNRYTCRFYDHEGGLLTEIALYYGEEIVPPSPPVRPDDALYSYVFAGWQGFVQGMTVTGDLSFSAAYVQQALDKQAPTFADVEDGDAYYVPFGLTVTDDQGVVRLWLDGRELPCGGDKQMTITLPSDGQTHRIVAEDMAGNRSEVSLQSVSVSQVLSTLPETELAVYGAESLIKEALATVEALPISQLAQQDRLAVEDYRTAMLMTYRRSLAEYALLCEGESGIFLPEHMADADLLRTEDALVWLSGGQVTYVLQVMTAAETTKNELQMQAISRRKQAVLMYDVRLIRREITPEGAHSETEVNAGAGQCLLTVQTAWLQEKNATLLFLCDDEISTVEIKGQNEIPVTIGGRMAFGLLKDQQTAKTGMLAIALAVALMTALLLGGGLLLLVRLRARRIVNQVGEEALPAVEDVALSAEIQPDAAQKADEEDEQTLEEEPEENRTNAECAQEEADGE